MLNYEQCKAVVEDVWGFPVSEIWEDTRNWHQTKTLPDPEFISDFKEHQVLNEVNSWEGFGRTVEAMEKRGYDYMIVRSESRGHLWEWLPISGLKRRVVSRYLKSNHRFRAAVEAALAIIREEKSHKPEISP